MGFTKEQLVDDIAHAEEKSMSLCGPCADDHARLAYWLRIALASLEAEPVAYMSRQKAELREKFGTCDEWDLHHQSVEAAFPSVNIPESDNYEFMPLYTAPPSPVSVPDESAVELLATDLMKRIDKITGERHSVATLSSLRVSIVESCRTAMLNGEKS